MDSMKRLFTFGRKSDVKEIGKSMECVDSQVEKLCKEIRDLEKRIRIETKICQEVDRELATEKDKAVAADRKLADARREKNNLSQEIEQKSRFLECLKKSNEVLMETIDGLEKEAITRDNEFQVQMNRLSSAHQKYEKEYADHKRAQIRFNTAFDRFYARTRPRDGQQTRPTKANDDQLLKKKRNEVLRLKREIEAMEKHIRELNHKKVSEEQYTSQLLANFGDPHRVIVRMAEIKLESNRIQQEVDDFFASNPSVIMSESQIEDEQMSEADKPEDQPMPTGSGQGSVGSGAEIQRDPNRKVHFQEEQSSNIFGAQSPATPFVFTSGDLTSPEHVANNPFALNPSNIATPTASPANSNQFNLFGTPSDAQSAGDGFFNNFFGSDMETSDEKFNFF